ncbi:early protein E7 [Tadarida brasiliensis papillomavirus 1]|uniref:Protein E7 n=1 Tax=Tadarida brasiliensis papillomavirus 1 TaxID=2664215 RepID=A0A5Q2F570_9PAPI|nr:early protein E7 [Tadarida brasiliensis papillomavirus 1]
MRGEKSTIPDIVLEYQPSLVELWCDEELPNEFELEGEEQIQNQVPQQSQQSGRHYETFTVSMWCGICDHKIKLVCQATSGGIQSLEYLLVEDKLKFVCLTCVKHYGLH